MHRPRLGEGEVVKAILAKYQNHPACRLWRTNTGAVSIGSRFVRFGLKGQSDLQGVLKGGRAVFIEAKTRTGRLRPEQEAFGRMVQSMGALFVVARSLADVDAALSAAC